MPTALIFAGAPLSPTPRLRARLSSLAQPRVIAADSGAATALAFGFRPDVVVGDFDSLDPKTLEALLGQGVEVERHPRAKDATDGQLAIERAVREQPTALWLVGFLGGPRLDQAVAHLLLVATLDTPAVLFDALNECAVLRGPADHVWHPEPTEVVSLIAPSGAARGVTTRGLRWPLAGATLTPGSTRGVSNEPVSEEARVTVADGCLLLTRHFSAAPSPPELGDGDAAR